MQIDNINKALNKLHVREESNQEIPGEVIIMENRGGEDRVIYRYKGADVFTFGITRGSKRRSKSFWYVPRQMGLTNQEFKLLYECPMSKKEYNRKMIDEGKITNP